MRQPLSIVPDSLGVSIADGWVRNVVGTGIAARAAAQDAATDAPLTEWNVWADWHWKRWTEDPLQCDVEGHKSFLDFQALAVREMIVAGQTLIVFSYRPSAENVGLQLQLIEPEQLNLSLFRWAETGNDIVRGVELDEYGKAVAYHFYPKGHPLTTYRGSLTDSIRVEAARVCHIFRQDRARQSSGMSRFAPVLRELWHKKMYKQYTMIRARMEACLGAAIESPDASPDADLRGVLDANTPVGSAQTDGRGTSELTWEPGMIWSLPNGKKATFYAPQSPGGMYDPFTRIQSREIAAGAGLDYPTVTRDYSGNSFSGQRQGMIEMWKETEPETLRIINHLCRPAWERFVKLCVLERRHGMADPPNWADPIQRAYYLKADFVPPPRPWIDPANQAAAAKMMLEMKLDTFKRLCLELNGSRWSDNLEDAAEVKNYAARSDVGVTLPFEAADPKVAPAEPKPRESLP